MLKAWTQDGGTALLIIGLTFDRLKRRKVTPVHNIRMIKSSEIGSPFDVVLITADSRAMIADALAAEHHTIIASHDQPVWHCIRMKNKKKVLHVCMTQDELMVLRRHPLVSFYRLSGTVIDTPFDTLLVGGRSETEMVDFLKRTQMIGPTTQLELDQTMMGY